MKRIVVKVGSSTITHENGLLNLRKIEKLVCVLSDLKNAGHEILLVSSGAIAAGRGKMHKDTRPSSLQEKQALACIGQCELMYIYDKFFSQYSQKIGQLLITKEVYTQEDLKTNVIDTLKTLLFYQVIPVINENDGIAIDEIVYGDNDTLSAITASLVNADLLIVLSDIDGFYDKNPSIYKDAKKIDYITCIDEAILNAAEDTNSSVGTGGMKTKLQAAIIACKHQCDMIIASGDDPSILYDILDGKQVGTLFKSGGE